MNSPILEAERQHLANLIEAIQRCVYFLHASDSKVVWPLERAALEIRKKDAALFESLAAINERFAKLQDTLGAAMRHAAILMGETADTFLKVLSIYEKAGVIDSIAAWQLCRTARNLAAHDYETDYAQIAEHFNTLHEPRTTLCQASARIVQGCKIDLGVLPSSNEFADEFHRIVEAQA